MFWNPMTNSQANLRRGWFGGPFGHCSLCAMLFNSRMLPLLSLMYRSTRTEVAGQALQPMPRKGPLKQAWMPRPWGTWAVSIPKWTDISSTSGFFGLQPARRSKKNWNPKVWMPSQTIAKTNGFVIVLNTFLWFVGWGTQKFKCMKMSI